jgi:hypothetical protein
MDHNLDDDEFTKIDKLEFARKSNMIEQDTLD